MEKLPYIFDRFYQVGDSPTRKYEGSGIGQALGKELTDLLGGSLVVESQPQAGTRYQLVLPLQRPDKEEEPMVAVSDFPYLLD
ncbi:hypothetical protein BH24BAC1_BH24BAC1_27390 [soil metagenome]